MRGRHSRANDKLVLIQSCFIALVMSVLAFSPSYSQDDSDSEAPYLKGACRVSFARGVIVLPEGVEGLTFDTTVSLEELDERPEWGLIGTLAIDTVLRYEPIQPGQPQAKSQEKLTDESQITGIEINSEGLLDALRSLRCTQIRKEICWFEADDTLHWAKNLGEWKKLPDFSTNFLIYFDTLVPVDEAVQRLSSIGTVETSSGLVDMSRLKGNSCAGGNDEWFPNDYPTSVDESNVWFYSKDDFQGATNLPCAWGRIASGEHGAGVAIGAHDTPVNNTLSELSQVVNIGMQYGQPVGDMAHGTQTAGSIVAKGNNYGENGVEMVGVAHDASYYNYYTPTFLEAIVRAATIEECAVFNFCHAYSDESIPLSQELDSALYVAKQCGMIVVATTTNGQSEQVVFPAAWDTLCIGVSAHTASGNYVYGSYSTTREQVVVSSPGYYIATINYITGGRTTWSGTSAAAPILTGAIALAKSIDPTLSHEDIKDALQATADTEGLNMGNPIVAAQYGSGRLDIDAFLEYLFPMNVPDLAIVSISAEPEDPDPGERVYVDIEVANYGPGSLEDEYLEVWLYRESDLFCTEGGYIEGNNPIVVDSYHTTIQPGDTVTMLGSFVPQDGGVYGLQALVNGDSTILEGDYTNNCFDEPTYVTTRRLVTGRVVYFDWEHGGTEGVPFSAVDILCYSVAFPQPIDTTFTTDGDGYFSFIVPNETEYIYLQGNLTEGGEGGAYAIEQPTYDGCNFTTINMSNPHLTFSSTAFTPDDFAEVTFGPEQSPPTREDSNYIAGCNAIRAFYDQQQFMNESTTLNFSYDLPQWFRILTDPAWSDRTYSCHDNHVVTLKRWYGKGTMGSDDDRYMQHELAHVAYMQIRPDNEFGSGSHNICDTIPAPLAMAEGWADMVAALVPDLDPMGVWDAFCSYPDTQSIEENSWWFDAINPGEYKSEMKEGAIASLLFDIVDYDPFGGDDDGMAIPVGHLFDIYDGVVLLPGETFTVWHMIGCIIAAGYCDEYECEEISARMVSDHFWRAGSPFILAGLCGGYTDVDDSLEEDHVLPSEFAVGQNYPNPFNGCTHLMFDIPRSGMLTYSVYNALGQVVMGEMCRHLSAGEYDVALDFSSFASGVYFVRTKFEEDTKLVKMLYIK